jgi:hypothetical protein
MVGAEVPLDVTLLVIVEEGVKEGVVVKEGVLEIV